jgi:2-polyprenyl-6-methoxyphenol hydroxylase-like FAD-dependent oxidoreductase
MRVLISGASIAGPVLAYWLRRHGFEVTVVERAPTRRKTGGHTVDLFRPAMDIVERMGVLPRIQDKNAGTERLTVVRERGRPVDVDLVRLFHAVSDRHVEIMRDDLSEILQDACAEEVEYVFGDSIASITQDAAGVDVTFERGMPRRFDVVVGADGLHSNVRKLVFGDERGFSHSVGAYLAVLTLPNYLGLRDRTIALAEAGRMAGMYSARHMDDARALFLFRSERPLEYHHRDVPRQKELLREAYRGAGWEVPRLLAELDRTPAFYFDEITQLRMDTWSRGRVTLVGDAGYSPGPAIGGSTSLAIVGAYVLAGELAAAGGDPSRAFPACEHELRGYVEKSRTFALDAAKLIVPRTPFAVWAMAQVARLITYTPPRLARALANLNGTARLHDAFTLKDYGGHRAPTSAPAASISSSA